MNRITLLTAAVAVLAATLVAPAASAAPSRLDWGPCPTGPLPTPDLECATLEVPLDYRNADGRGIDITVSRLPSKNPWKRRGVLLTNPGGPGPGGLDHPQLLKLVGLPQDVLDAYDVIGFDPRGTGHSTPVACGLTPEQMAVGNLPYPNGPADVLEQAELAKAQAKRCADAETGPLHPHITTANTARDMDRVREALGESAVSYLGTSYGTYLGAVYATVFPHRSDRFVLDSNPGPGGYDIQAMHGFARGMEDRFPDFAEFAATHPRYALGTTPAQVTAKFHELAARLDRTPVGGVTGSLFRGLTFGKLYSEDMTALAEDWQALDEGRPPAPEPGFDNLDNIFSARFAVICGDSPWPRSVATYQVEVEVHRLRSPLLGAAAANISACAYWPTAPLEPKVRITDRGPSNVLMVQNERDPSTPLAGARTLRSALGARARMVTVDQGGHGVYLFGANHCGNAAVTEFLVTGERPATDVRCAAGVR